MSLKKIFYQTIAFVKYHKEIFYYKNQTNNFLKKHKTKPLTQEIKFEIKNKFTKYGFKNISTKWHRLYKSFYKNLNNEIVIDFIPEHLFYTKIEPALNQAIMYPSLEDKNLLDKFFPSSLLPETIVKNSNGFYYIDNTQVSIEAAIKKCCTYDEFVIKPSIGTYGGEGVRKIELSDLGDKYDRLKTLFLEYNSDFIVQVILKQNSKLSILNATSINTIRVISYMRANEVIPLSAVIRIGRSGEFTDNQSLGGIVCGINEEGKLKKFALDKKCNRYLTTDNGTLLENFQIPHFNKILAAVKNKHGNIPYFKLISWDITIDDKSDVKIIEFNAIGQGINLHQMTNGPLFGQFTDEILSVSQKYNALDQLMKYGK